MLIFLTHCSRNEIYLLFLSSQKAFFTFLLIIFDSFEWEKLKLLSKNCVIGRKGDIEACFNRNWVDFDDFTANIVKYDQF